jgi:hypothetical protein
MKVGGHGGIRMLAPSATIVHIGMCRLKYLQDSGQRKPLNKFSLLCITLYSFPFMSFYVVSHENVFNEVMCTQNDVYLLTFPIRVFIREKRKIYTMLIVILLNCPRDYMSSSQHTRLSTFIFPQGF